MAPRSKAIGVGAFVIGGLVLFGVGLFLIGDRRMLFSDTFRLASEFHSLAGLQNGATVRVEGMDAGEVRAIHVPAGPAAKFRVEMQVRNDLRPLIRTDSVASIQTDGLVGSKFVQIEAGSEQAAAVADGAVIAGREPFEMTDLLQKMSDTVDTVNATVTDVKAEIDQTLAAITDTAQTTQALVEDVGDDVRGITEAGRRATANIDAIVAQVRAGRGTVGKLVADDALYERIRKMTEDAERAMTNVREATREARGAIADFRGENGSMKGVTGDLAATLASAREAMSDLAENTEALKHNFFFRGFFNRRGFFDLGGISVRDYRAGALTRSGRVPLRIWLSSPVIFARDANGAEQLTDGGRLRIDSAMSQFVRYPRGSPIVVEGYAHEATGDERYRQSRARATQVRDYIVTRFDVDPRYIAVMPMGSDAPHSPSGDTWDGVALAMFVEKDALGASSNRGTGFD
jgi:phospholipid/cholesterol/gamma-HCH transport system substrate-binding protein